MRFFSILIGFVLVATSVAAGSQRPYYTASNFLKVYPLADGSFEVVQAFGEGPRGLWCAAASYALYLPGDPPPRLYIKSGYGPSTVRPGRKGVIFTSDPTGLTPHKGVSVSIRDEGYNLPWALAHTFCHDKGDKPDRDGFSIQF